MAQIITAKIIGAAMGLFGIGRAAVAGVGGYGAGTPAGTMNMGSWSTLPGHAAGIESVPETGIYKLHKSEKVVPAYDANNNKAMTVEIHNFITPQAIAQAMASREGKGVIVNVIDENSLRYGVVKREVVKR